MHSSQPPMNHCARCVPDASRESDEFMAFRPAIGIGDNKRTHGAMRWKEKPFAVTGTQLGAREEGPAEMTRHMCAASKTRWRGPRWLRCHSNQADGTHFLTTYWEGEATNQGQKYRKIREQRQCWTNVVNQAIEVDSHRIRIEL